MYRSMKSDPGRQEKSCSQQRKQSFEDHDGCVENDEVGFHPISQNPIEESDSHQFSLPKRARMETRSGSVCDEKVQFGEGIKYETVMNPYSVEGGDDYVQSVGETRGIIVNEGMNGFGLAQFLQPNHHLYTLNPFGDALQGSEFLKSGKKGDHTQGSVNMDKNEEFKWRCEEESGVCGLSLSLSLQHPSTQRSNASSMSEISEAISSPLGSSSFKDYSGSSEERSVNLDLSIALCGN